MLHNTTQSYGWMTKLLHWLLAIAIIGLIIVGLYMADLEPSDQKWTLYGLHKSTGVLVGLFVLFRLYWRVKNPVPELPANLPKWEVFASELNIKLLYVLMVLMPLSGLTMSLLGGHPVSVFGWVTFNAISEKSPIAGLAKEIHEFGGTLFAFLVGIHIAAAFYHHLLRKNDILRRMM